MRMADMTTLDQMPDIAEIPSIGASEVHDEFTSSDHMPISLHLRLPFPKSEDDDKLNLDDND